MQCSAKVSSSSHQRPETVCLHKEASIARAEKTECSLLTLSSGDLSTSEAQLPQKRGKNGTEMGKLKVWMKTGSHYPAISGSSLISQQFSCAPEHTWSFLLLRGTFPKEYHNLIKKSFLLLFMLRFSQATNPPPRVLFPMSLTLHPHKLITFGP